jgi:hypothetical protein
LGRLSRGWCPNLKRHQKTSGQASKMAQIAWQQRACINRAPEAIGGPRTFRLALAPSIVNPQVNRRWLIAANCGGSVRMSAGINHAIDQVGCGSLGWLHREFHSRFPEYGRQEIDCHMGL